MGQRGILLDACLKLRLNDLTLKSIQTNSLIGVYQLPLSENALPESRGTPFSTVSSRVCIHDLMREIKVVTVIDLKCMH